VRDDLNFPNKVAEYLKRPYARIFIRNDDNSITCGILEFEGCVTQGDTFEEADANLTDAAEGWLDVSVEQGRQIPPPRYWPEDEPGGS